MSEQNKKNKLISAVIALAIIVIVAIIWVVVNRQKNKPSHSENIPVSSEADSKTPVTEQPAQTSDETATTKEESAPATTSKETNADPKIKLSDVIKKARTWGAVNYSWYGKTAPDFTLTDINGKTHKLSDYRGKDIILVFWATWCPPCRAEIPHLIELRNTVGKDKLAILAISDEAPDLVKQFAEYHKMNYTILLDTGKMPQPFGVQRIYGTTGLPGSFFVDNEGKIKLATVGTLLLSDMEAVLQAE